MPSSATLSIGRPLARFTQRLFRQVSRAYKTSTQAQWIAYVIVVVALCLIVVVSMHRAQQSNDTVTEPYASGTSGPKDYSHGQSGNCQRSKLAGGTDKDLQKKLQCNQQTASDEQLTQWQCVPCNVTYPKSFEFEQAVTIKRRAADMNSGVPPATGMASVKLCSDATCKSNDKRTLQDVVDEYRDQHLPTELKKVKVNQEQIQKATQTIGEHVCAFNTYAINLKTSNDKISQANQTLRDERDKLTDEYTTLNSKLPDSVQHLPLVFDN